MFGAPEAGKTEFDAVPGTDFTGERGHDLVQLTGMTKARMRSILTRALCGGLGITGLEDWPMHTRDKRQLPGLGRTPKHIPGIPPCTWRIYASVHWTAQEVHAIRHWSSSRFLTRLDKKPVLLVVLTYETRTVSHMSRHESGSGALSCLRR